MSETAVIERGAGLYRIFLLAQRKKQEADAYLARATDVAQGAGSEERLAWRDWRDWRDSVGNVELLGALDLNEVSG